MGCDFKGKVGKIERMSGASRHGCIAVMVILIIAGAIGYIYFREKGFQLPWESMQTIKGATDSQKREYLKGVSAQIKAINSLKNPVGEFISDVKGGRYKTQMDINKHAMDIENRLDTALSEMRKLKVPEQFAEGHSSLLASITDYYDCLKKLKRLNSSAMAGNIDMIDSTLTEIDKCYQSGNEKLAGGISLLIRKQKELRL